MRMNDLSSPVGLNLLVCFNNIANTADITMTYLIKYTLLTMLPVILNKVPLNSNEYGS